MLKIWMPLADGECIKPEVMKGILEQTTHCCICPITSKGSDIRKSIEARESITRNRNRIRSLAEEDFIIMMDSDVVLKDKDIIKEVYFDLHDFDCVICPTTKGQHGIIGFQKKKFPKLKHTSECSICEAIKSLNVKKLERRQEEWR